MIKNPSPERERAQSVRKPEEEEEETSDSAASSKSLTARKKIMLNQGNASMG